MDFWIFPLALTVFINTVRIDASITDEPVSTQNAAVLRGGAFHLKCISSHRVCGALQWLKRDIAGNEETISYGRSLMNSFGGRYAMNASGVPCDVTVNNVQVSDAGEFACLSANNDWKSAFLAVLETPVRCWHSSSDGLVMEGESVSFYCSLDRYRSSVDARLDWLDSHNQAVLTDGVSQRPGAINSTFLVSARSPVIHPFTCRISFQPIDSRTGAARNVPEVMCNTETVRVVYPVRDMRLRMNGTRLTSGKVVTCLADGEPRPTFRWVTLTTGDVTYSNKVLVATGHVYQCIATNVIRGVEYREASWEIYVMPDTTTPGVTTKLPVTSTLLPSSSTTRTTSLPMSSSTTSLATSSSSSSSSSITTISIAQTSISQLELFPVNSNDVIVDENDVTEEDAVIKIERNVNMSSLVLGILLLLSIVVILVLIVRLCRLHKRVKEIKYLESNGRQPTLSVSQNPTHAMTVAAARQIMTPVESNGSAKSQTNHINTRHADVVYKPLSKPIHVNNGVIHDDVYLEIDKKT